MPLCILFIAWLRFALYVMAAAYLLASGCIKVQQLIGSAVGLDDAAVC
jgi:hypothetical protein